MRATLPLPTSDVDLFADDALHERTPRSADSGKPVPQGS